MPKHLSANAEFLKTTAPVACSCNSTTGPNRDQQLPGNMNNFILAYILLCSIVFLQSASTWAADIYGKAGNAVYGGQEDVLITIFLFRGVSWGRNKHSVGMCFIWSSNYYIQSEIHSVKTLLTIYECTLRVTSFIEPILREEFKTHLLTFYPLLAINRRQI